MPRTISGRASEMWSLNRYPRSSRGADRGLDSYTAMCRCQLIGEASVQMLGSIVGRQVAHERGPLRNDV